MLDRRNITTIKEVIKIRILRSTHFQSIFNNYTWMFSPPTNRNASKYSNLWTRDPVSELVKAEFPSTVYSNSTASFVQQN